MAATEDLFTPVHKALRSMIYDLGRRLQTVDFADSAASSAILADLQYEFSHAVSATCVLCLLHAHAGHEETYVFPSVQPLEPALIRLLIDDHQEITRRLAALAKRAHELGALDSTERRLELGSQINREANELFAFYLGHMNKEEARVVPVMREHFTNEEMRAMQGAIIASMPPDRLAAFLKWMLSSLAVGELTELLTGVKHSAPPPLLELVNKIGTAHVDPARWAVVRERVGF